MKLQWNKSTPMIKRQRKNNLWIYNSVRIRGETNCKWAHSQMRWHDFKTLPWNHEDRKWIRRPPAQSKQRHWPPKATTRCHHRKLHRTSPDNKCKIWGRPSKTQADHIDSKTRLKKKLNRLQTWSYSLPAGLFFGLPCNQHRSSSKLVWEEVGEVDFEHCELHEVTREIHHLLISMAWLSLSQRWDLRKNTSFLYLMPWPLIVLWP